MNRIILKFKRCAGIGDVHTHFNLFMIYSKMHGYETVVDYDEMCNDMFSVHNHGNADDKESFFSFIIDGYFNPLFDMSSILSVEDIKDSYEHITVNKTEDIDQYRNKVNLDENGTQVPKTYVITNKDSQYKVNLCKYPLVFPDTLSSIDKTIVYDKVVVHLRMGDIALIKHDGKILRRNMKHKNFLYTFIEDETLIEYCLRRLGESGLKFNNITILSNAFHRSHRILEDNGITDKSEIDTILCKNLQEYNDHLKRFNEFCDSVTVISDTSYKATRESFIKLSEADLVISSRSQTGLVKLNYFKNKTPTIDIRNL